MRILCVDDERYPLEDLVEICKSLPEAESVAGFTRATEALEYAEGNRVDLAFLDIEMRGINGITLAEKLRALQPKICIVFTTGYTEYALEAFSVHANGYLTKPIRREKIVGELAILFPQSDRLRLRCFGEFEVLYHDKPVPFKHQKTKEVLAYLTDCRGSARTSRDIMAVIWEEDNANYLRLLRKELLDTLASLGCADAVVRSGNSLAVNVKAVDCDYYDFLAGNGGKVYGGEYMNQYSWAESTHAALLQRGAKEKPDK